jgi:hypothetical protein
MISILGLINVIGLLLTVALTIYLVLTFRKPRQVSLWGKILSVVISLAMLLFFILISGAKLNLLVGLPILIVGGVLGFIRGLAMKFSYQENQVIARGSWLFLLVWGGSWIIAQLINFFGSRLLSAVGLIPVFFSTGTQLGLDGILLLRRIVVYFRPPPGMKAVS